MTATRLEAFKMPPVAPELVPCTQERAWMEPIPAGTPTAPAIVDRQHPWLGIADPGGFEIEWNGGPRVAS